ncbi:MAG: 50S ribosomal protein L10 [Planctomycetes bacterium]|nr:50S ribosomal protein L10 [Planctomycetota bacterium]
MSKLVKSLMVAEYRQELRGVSSCVLLDVSPLTVAEMEDFRRHLREREVRLRVLRNRLAHHAVGGLTLEAVRPLLVGPTAIAFNGRDLEGVQTAKAVRGYLDQHKAHRVTVKGGLSEGLALGPAGMEQLARTPGRLELRAQLAAAVLGPARGLAAAIAGVTGGLARAIQARIDKAGGGEE